jgi:hypothetical protein
VVDSVADLVDDVAEGPRPAAGWPHPRRRGGRRADDGVAVGA